MTKKERVLCAINHKEADRVPKGEIWVDGNLANKLLGKEYPLDYQHFERDKEVRELLKMDLVNVGDWPSEEIGIDSRGNKKYKSNYGYEYICSGKSKRIIKPPIDSIEDADKYKIPDIKKVSASIIKDFSSKTDFFVFAQISGPVSTLDEMFPMEVFMVYCLTNTKEMKIIGERVIEYEIMKARLFIDNGADAILVTDDIAFNTGVFLPPKIMDELVYPFYKFIVKEIKKYKDIPVFFHSDGNLNSVMDKIIESGFDGIHSLQPSAGMEISEIKKQYGSDLCLMGNIDLDYILTFAEPCEVEKVVRKTIDAAADGGGFILSSCNSLVDAVTVENALVMYMTAHDYGLYKK